MYTVFLMVHYVKESTSVTQTGFVDQDNPKHVYKAAQQALYGFKKAHEHDKDMLFIHFTLPPKSSLKVQLILHYSPKKGKDILLMSMMGKMSFFLGLQIFQSLRGIFLNQSKYALEIIKKYGMETSDSVDIPMVQKSKLDEDLQGKAVDPIRYRRMIGFLMYITSIRPDLVFIVCMYADHASCQDTRRSISGSMQLLGD
ncbi:retrovirus-related pol polyprotein from transposon TNT 1-94 [Tanacetum coccineum]